jgi:hypothetical protein
MIQNLTAAQFDRFMSSGRTSPALCGCEDAEGNAVGEYVVKLRGAIQERGLLSELLGSRLATYFGIPSPLPALINLEQELVDLIAGREPSKAVLVRGSVGLNFGTKAEIGFSTWPVDKHIPEAMWDTAVNIFAFDALMQNPDRRHINPNLLSKGDTIIVFDHEIGFSFLLDIFPSLTPWDLRNQRYLEEHVFFRQLKAKFIDLTGFTAKLSEMSEKALADIFADVPAEWNNEDSMKIAQHLSALHDHAEEFAEQIRRFLV